MAKVQDNPGMNAAQTDAPGADPAPGAEAVIADPLPDLAPDFTASDSTGAEPGDAAEHPVSEAPATAAKAADSTTDIPVAPRPMPRAEPPLVPDARPVGGSGNAGAILAMLLGGVIAAGIGFAASRYVPEGWPMAVEAPLESRLMAQTDEIANLRNELRALQERTDAGDAPVADQMAQIQGTAQQVSDAVAGFQNALADLNTRVADVASRVERLEQAPATGAPSDPAAVSALQDEVAALRAQVSQQQAGGSEAVSGIEEAVRAAEARIAEAETKADALRTEAEATAASARRTGAVALVMAALDSGAPFAVPLAELGDSAPPALASAAATGVPTITALQDGFEQPARAALDASRHAQMGDSWSERLTTFVQTQTGARSLSPREGSDPDAVLSRAEAAVKAGDLDASLAEIATLPPEGQAALADWVASAKVRLDATSAAAALAASAN